MWAKFASIILRNRHAIIIGLVVVTTVFAFFARKVQLSYEMAQVLPATDSTHIEFENFKQQFGQDGSILVVGTNQEELYQLAPFRDWYELSKSLKEIEGVNEVVSLSTILDLKRIRSEKRFEPTPIFQKAPESQEELDSLLDKARSLQFYEGFLFKNDNPATLIALTLDNEWLDSKDRSVLMNEILLQTQAFEDTHSLTLHYSGLPYIRANNTTKVSEEIKLFIVLAIFVTATILLLFFRSFKAMFFSMLVVLIGVIWAVGIQVILGYKITILTGLIPPLIIVIGIPNCIFILNKYHQEYKHHGNQIKALSRVIEKIGNAIFLTNTTTGLGFATFIFTDSDILIEFGMVASLGILSVFVISITLMPIISSFQKPPKMRHTKHLERRWVHTVVNRLEQIVTKHRPWVYITTLLIIVASIYGTTLMETTGNIADDLPRNDPVYLDLRFFEKNFNGVLPFEVTIDTRKKGGAFKRSTLKKIDRLQNIIAEYPEFSKPVSIVEGLKFAKQGYYNGNPKKYSLFNGQEQSFIGPYLRNADGGNEDLLQTYVDSNRQVTRVTAQVADVGSNRMDSIITELRPKVDSIFNPADFDVILTGTSYVWLKGTNYLVKNLFLSLSIAIVLISIIMSFLFSSVRMVLVSLIPNLLPLLVTAALMGFFEIAIKPSTILIFSIAFGISVDDTIHYLAKYRQELRGHAINLREAAILALRETGVSMIYTSIVLFFGFGVFSASEFGGTVALGVLVSITLLVAMCSNLILLPSLLLTFDRWVTTKAFEKEPLMEITDEEEDIDLDELEIDSMEEITKE